MVLKRSNKGANYFITMPRKLIRRTSINHASKSRRGTMHIYIMTSDTVEKTLPHLYESDYTNKKRKFMYFSSINNRDLTSIYMAEKAAVL